MFMRKLLVSAMIAAGTLGAVVLPLPGVAASNVNIQLNFGPPAPRYEAVPAPRRGYIWSPGHWAWDGYRHVWVAGQWEPLRPGYSYHASNWYERSGRWYYQPSYWEPIPSVGPSGADIQLGFGPPPPRYEPVPAPRGGYIWSAGYWAWDGRPSRLDRGHWERARPVILLCAELGQRDGRMAYRSPLDSDRDGIPITVIARRTATALATGAVPPGTVTATAFPITAIARRRQPSRLRQRPGPGPC